jgi:hypothetical protein
MVLPEVGCGKLPAVATTLVDVLHSLGVREDRGYDLSSAEDVADEVGEKHTSAVERFLDDAARQDLVERRDNEYRLTEQGSMQVHEESE